MGKTYKDRRKQYASDEDYRTLVDKKKKQSKKFRKSRNKELKDLMI